MPCDLLGAELALDRVDAALAAELPAHMHAFAHAHAAGTAAPPAPLAARRPATLAAARDALAHPILADRGAALLRLVAPLAIEADAAVATARAAAVSWEALGALAAARDAAARRLFGASALDVAHRLMGVPAAAPPPSDAVVPDAVSGAGAATALPAPIAGWHAPDGAAIGEADLARAWAALQARHGVRGAVAFARAATHEVRPRAFVVEAGAAVIVVAPAVLDSPAARFAAAHELGHAVAALAQPAGIPRALDEAAAAYIARELESLGAPWASPLAAAARVRRRALAAALARIERALPTTAERPTARPPWALWHDPYAQAAYVAAETLADELAAAVAGGSTFTEALAAHRERIDRAMTLT